MRGEFAFASACGVLRIFGGVKGSCHRAGQNMRVGRCRVFRARPAILECWRSFGVWRVLRFVLMWTVCFD